MNRPVRLAFAVSTVVCGAVVAPVLEAASREHSGRTAGATARDVVEAVNALVRSDIPIDAAERTACALDRLPSSRAALVSLVSGRHRALIEECARGRPRVQRHVADFDLLGLVDEPGGRRADVATVRAFFAGRPVDVGLGTGLSEGPYPIRFDWAVVLDPRSGTLFSFVFNCTD